MPTSTAATSTILSSLLLAGLLGLTPALAAQWSEHHKLLPDDGQAGSLFGSAVSTDGTLVAVGAPRADELGTDSGSAYVFGAQSGSQLLQLAPVDGAPGDQFGFSIAIDGPYVIVGAPLADGAGLNSGAAYVFDAATGLQLFELAPVAPAAGNQFGYAVAIEGGLVVVGTLGGAYLFDAATGQQLEELLPDGGLPVGGSGVATIAGGFGQAVDIGGGRIVVGAKTANGSSLYSGAAYVFDTSGNELHKLNGGPAWSQFGGSVGIDGTTAVIGAKYASPNGKDSGNAHLFDALTGQPTGNLAPSDGHVFQHFGSSVGIDGLHIVIGAEWDNGGGFSAGAMYLYEVQGGSFITKLLASDGFPNDDLGAAVAIANGIAVAGAASDDDDGTDSGSAYVFDGAGWTDLGFALAGTNGEPLLDGTGALVEGEPLSFALSDALAFTTAWLVVGFTAINAPFEGGVLVPSPEPPGLVVALPTGPTGSLTVGGSWPAGVPSNFTVWVQYWVEDPGGPFGWAASNAVSATTP